MPLLEPLKCTKLAQGQPWSPHPRGLHCHHLWEGLIHSWAWWGKAFTDEETRPRQKAPCQLVVQGISSQPGNSPRGTGVKWISGFPTPCLSLLALILPADHTAQFMNKTNHDPWTPRDPTPGSKQRIPQTGPWQTLGLCTGNVASACPLLLPRTMTLYSPCISATSFLGPSIWLVTSEGRRSPKAPDLCHVPLSVQWPELECPTLVTTVCFQRAENYGKSFWTLPVLHNLLHTVKFHAFWNCILATNFLWLSRSALSLCFSFSRMLIFLGTCQQIDWCSFRRAQILIGCW